MTEREGVSAAMHTATFDRWLKLHDAQVRADERMKVREKIAAAIEATAGRLEGEWYLIEDARAAFAAAARIARNGGGDE